MDRDDLWWVALGALAIWIYLIDRRCGRRGSRVLAVTSGVGSAPTTTGSTGSPGCGGCD
jgi:hypothetical protein